MKKQMMMMLFGGAMLVQAACGLVEEPGQGEPWNPTDPPVDPPVTMKAELDVVYISGHLGNYSSCPEKGYTPGGSMGEARAEADFAPGAGACAPAEPGADVSEDYCGGGFQSCEEAQLTMEFGNLSADVIAAGISVKLIEVLDDERMVRAVLPVNDVVVISDMMSFDGGLDAGEKVKVRVDYKGPVNLYDILSSDSSDSGRGFYNGAQLRITVGADNADDVVLETKAVQQIPDVAT